MGITGLLPFIEKASRRVNIGEFSGCTVAIDSYCWLHKGAFACADKLVRGEETNVHINYCMKYVDMLLEKNVKPILVFDGRHLPAKAMTESKRRESRNASKKRAAELLRLGKMEEARSYMRRSVDITHEMALALIKECRNRNIDCIVAPYEADAQLAYLNIRNIAHIVITEDSDLILFGCTKVLFKMDLCGFGTLVETEHLPLVMKCPIEHYTFNKFRQMCIMSGCDYLASLPGIGLAKARQFVTATQDTNFANALRKLPGFFNRANLTVTDEYRENFLKAEATFKHQYVYDPIERKMVRLTEPDNEDIEQALCVNAGEMLDPKVAFQLALGNLDPFTLNKMDDWHPDHRPQLQDTRIKTNKWKEKGTSNHSSIWSEEFTKYLADPCPWQKKVKKLDPFVGITRGKTRKVVNLVSKCVPETQDDSLSIETLSNMYCLEPLSKRKKIDDQNDDQNEDQNDDAETTIGLTTDETVPRKTSPILENKQRSFKKILNNGSYSVLKRLSKFPRTVIDENVVESKFFSSTEQKSTEFTSEVKEQKIPEHSRNPFKVSTDVDSGIDTQTEFESKFESNSKFELNCKSELDLTDCESQIEDSQKENSMKKSINPIVNGSPMKKSTSPIVNGSPIKKRISPILEASPRNPFKRIERTVLSQDSVIENTEEYSYPSSSQESSSRPTLHNPSFYKRTPSQTLHSSQPNKQLNGVKRSTCRVPGLKRTTSLPSNQPTLLSKFGFQKKPVLKM